MIDYLRTIKEHSDITDDTFISFITFIDNNIKDIDNPIISSVLKYKDPNIKPLVPLTTAQIECVNKYLFDPIDEPLDDFFIGENPHSIIE